MVRMRIIITSLLPMDTIVSNINNYTGALVNSALPAVFTDSTSLLGGGRYTFTIEGATATFKKNSKDTYELLIPETIILQDSAGKKPKETFIKNLQDTMPYAALEQKGGYRHKRSGSRKNRKSRKSKRRSSRKNRS